MVVPLAERGRAGFLGAAIPLRALPDLPLPPDADLSNVVPFARRRPGEEREAPVIAVDSAARIAPWWSRGSRAGFAVLLAGSLGLHASLYAFFNRQPEPLASIGIESISVEIVLGAHTAAGLEKTPSPLEAEVSSKGLPEEKKPEEAKAETAKENPDAANPESDTVIAEQGPDEIKAAAAEIKPAEETKPREEAKPAVDENAVEETKPVKAAKAPEPEAVKPEPALVAPAEATPAPQQPELAAAKTEYEQPSIIAPEPTPKKQEPKPQEEQTAAIKDAPKKPRGAKRANNRGEDARDRAPPASTFSLASSGIGVGRSDLDTNYAGIVRAHLARYKQYPAEARARGNEGDATVTFSLDASGAVTSVKLAHGSGFESLDQESIAMVRRASPFPTPPNGRAQSFTVPVGFTIR